MLLMGTAVLALGLAGCETKTTVLPPDQEAPGLTATGTGSAFGEPDVAVLNLGVQADAATVSAARDQAAQAMQAIKDDLSGRGVDDKDMQTSRFSIQPRYEDGPDQRMVIVGYTVDNILTVKIRKIDDTGAIIDGAVAAGGNLTRVDSLSFTIDDPTELENQARTEAVAKARAKAETLAEAAGVTLGEPRTISESGGPTPIVAEGAADVAQARPETPIELGELEVQISVQVVWGIE
jgi:uncharacterized protein YggE